MILIGFGVAAAIIAAAVLGDEWRRAGSQNARINGLGLRVEIVVAAAIVIGAGVAMAYAGVSA